MDGVLSRLRMASSATVQIKICGYYTTTSGIIYTSTKGSYYTVTEVTRDKLQINVTIDPVDTTDGITYHSSNQDIITVDEDGKVKAIGTGTATVIITSGGVTQTITFTIITSTKYAIYIIPSVLVVILVGILAFYFIRRKK